MSCMQELAIKHALALDLVKAFAQREDLTPTDIVGMAFHTAGLVVKEITEEAKQVLAQCKCNEEATAQEELARILNKFFKSTPRS